jgi:hypothetical protein
MDDPILLTMFLIAVIILHVTDRSICCPEIGASCNALPRGRPKKESDNSVPILQSNTFKALKVTDI